MTAAQVLVIGAGPAGIASAYYLQRAGIPYLVVDRANVIASTWANLYPSLRLNTSKWWSHLPGQPMPRSYWIFPTGKQYHRYLETFVAQHPLNIRLGVKVQRVSRENDGWRVEMCEENGSLSSAWYPCVILATGRFGNPYIPDFEGLDRFKGTVIHARDYHGTEAFAGQRVLVVGSGPSGLDIAPELGEVARRPVLLAIRTGLILRPRYPLGLPKHLWMMLAERLPKQWGERLLKWIGERRIRGQERYGIKTPPTGKESSAAAARGRELLDAVKAGKVQPVDAPVRFGEGYVELENGAVYEIDAVILGTGYRPVLYDYLDYPVTVGKDYWPVRDPDKDSNDPTNRELQNAPGLYLVGVFYQGKGALYNCNIEAEEAVRQIAARLATRSGNG